MHATQSEARFRAEIAAADSTSFNQSAAPGLTVEEAWKLVADTHLMNQAIGEAQLALAPASR